ncbi:metallophosphoesterase family protein [Cohnella terricola]|uniref:Phosphoesterase n=1 Tax=Cohnella terricola TaxID=1289167 RepID=A0A559J633_9BACL|nr:metallophosphoesterase [Cohnella terricola]TVX95311.1 metallophosphoesterase [Cohnella terricola]
MKIIVVSDTHMPRMGKKLPERLRRELKGADAIIHAGDWTKMSVYEELATYAPVHGVIGNNDGEELSRRFANQILLEIGGFRIGVVHGHGAAKRSSTEAYAIEAFHGTTIDVLVYGHSHIPVLKRSGGLLVFNPGSPTDKRRQPLYSFGVFAIDGKEIKAGHVRYANKS